MNKSILFITSAVILLAGCAKVEDQNNEVVPENGKHIVTLRAKVDESNTRVSIDGAGNYSWQDYDEIDVLTSDGQYAWGYINENYGSTADFYVELYDDASLGQYAYYPSAGRSWNDDYTDPNVFVLNSYYNYQKDVSFMPMLGTISSNGATFKSVGGVLKVPINNIPVDAHLLQVYVEGKRVTGGFPITVVNGNKQINAEPFPEGGDCIYIEFWGSDDVDSDPEVGNGANNRVFYIPLPCGIYHNLEFSIYENEPDESGLLFTRTATIAGGLEVERNDIITAKALDVVIEKNTPDHIVFDELPSDCFIDANGVLQLDQFDDKITLTAAIYGKNEEKRLEDLDEDLVSCQLIDMTGQNQDPITIPRSDYWFDYSDNNCTRVCVTPTSLHGDLFKLVIIYPTDDPSQPIMAESSYMFKVYEAKEIPVALADWSYKEGYFINCNDDWFEEYRVDRRAIDGKVYLKQYAASLRTEELPDYAFAGSFTSEETGGVFDALECFSHITSIPSNAFKACTSLKGVSLPPLVESIGDFAFQGCSGLVSIVLPDGVETIGESAFSACSNLSEVTISSTSALNSIGKSAFKECTSLGGFYLPSGVTEISSSAFYGCSMLSNINLDNVTSIGSSAFNGCALNEVSLNGCTLIGFSAFYGCSALTSVTIETSSENGMELGSSAFAYCTNLNSISLPSNLEIMPSSCFEGCTSLQSITLPESLVTIDEAAFFQSGLTSISLPDGVTSIGRLAFDDCALTSMVIPESVVSIGGYAFGSSFDHIVFMGTTPPSINASCFFYTRGDFIAYVPDGYVQAYVGAWCDESDDTSWIKSINELTPSSN